MTRLAWLRFQANYFRVRLSRAREARDRARIKHFKNITDQLGREILKGQK